MYVISARQSWLTPLTTNAAARFGYTFNPWAESVVATNLRFRKHSRLSSRITRCTRLRLMSTPQRRNSAVIRRLPYLPFHLRDPRLLRPFLPHPGKRPLPKLIYIAAPAVEFLAAHFQAARHQTRWLTRPQSLHRIQFELLGELPSRPHPSFPFRCILGLNWLSQNRGPLHIDPPNGQGNPQ